MTHYASSPLRPLTRSIAILLLIGTAALNATSVAVTRDSNPGTAGIQDGAGTSDTVTNNWINGGSNVLWGDTNDATVGGGVDGSYAVTVALNPTAASLNFNSSGYALSA